MKKEQAPNYHRLRNKLWPLASAGIAVGLALSACKSEEDMNLAPISGAVNRMDIGKLNVKELTINGTPYNFATAKAGEAGPAGPVGSKGDSGPDGRQGPDGKTGPIGPQGTQGKDGIQGIPGMPGIQEEKGEAATTPTLTPEATPRMPVVEIDLDGVKIRTVNIPQTVKQANVDIARSPFTNTIGGGTEAFIASPGGVLVGPDFGYTGSENPFGANPNGWKTMYESGGSIKPFSPVTQEVLRYEGPASQNLPEGGFVVGSWGQARVQIGDVIIDMPQRPNNDWIFIARGTNGDNKQDTDRNSTMRITNYKPGHALVEMFQARDLTGLAFISEGQFIQKVADAHSRGTNGGDGGNSMVTIIMYDTNSGAFTIIEQKKGRLLPLAEYTTGWKARFSNIENTRPTK